MAGRSDPDEEGDEPSSSGAAAGQLAGRVVLVTGASSGIGEAIAIAAARAGADVALTYRGNLAGAEGVAAVIRAEGRRSAVFRLDLADEGSIAALPAAVRQSFGRVDAWINNAGADILTGDAASRSRLERLDELIAVDLRGTMLASWAAVELLAAQPEGGCVINIGWDQSLTGMAGVDPQMFAAVKGGVTGFSKSLARTVAPRVRVNVLAPGWIETAFGASLDEARYRAIADATPLGRWGTPEDVAGAAVFLASPAASYLTGQTLAVGGGGVM